MTPLGRMRQIPKDIVLERRCVGKAGWSTNVAASRQADRKILFDRPFPFLLFFFLRLFNWRMGRPVHAGAAGGP